MRISLDKAEMCLKLMLEGMSIRSIQRITGVHQETILNLLTLAGDSSVVAALAVSVARS